jgi:hypothetical protein
MVLPQRLETSDCAGLSRAFTSGTVRFLQALMSRLVEELEKRVYGRGGLQ